MILPKLSLFRRLLKIYHPEGVGLPETILYDAVSTSDVFQSYYDMAALDIMNYADHTGVLLDVGTGPGRLLLKIHERAPGMQLSGIDLSPHMLSRARHNIEKKGLSEKISLKPGSAESIPYPENSFDIVVSTASIHHWKNPDACLNEIHRVLKRGGRALLYDLVSDTPREKVAEMKRRFGRLMTLMLFIHSFEEPFYTYEAFASLPEATPFKEGDVKWVGILCSLALKKE